MSLHSAISRKAAIFVLATMRTKSLTRYYVLYLSGTLAPEVRDNGDGTYDVTYVPPSEGNNVKAKITWDGKDIPNRYGHTFLTTACQES
jgi:hypothetical protein